MEEELIELIIEDNLSEEEEALIKKIANIKYKLPIINSLVIEIKEKDFEIVENMKFIKQIYENVSITMQMNVARKVVNADIVQEKGYLGDGVGIAILDTGVSPINDFTKPNNRIVAFKDFINNKKYPYDDNGHGTHVAGISSGNGINSGGKYAGVAPKSNIIGVKVLNSEGKGNAGNVLAGIQWVLDNKDKYNIRILNLSIGTNNTSTKDPLVKAVEKAWDMGVVVTIAAGNNGPEKSSITSPAISKKVITIGASDDHQKAKFWGNTLINFSGRGPTLECVVKPDVIAPGVNIISCLSNNISNKSDDVEIIDNDYFSLSGTSMATPIVAGAIALLLEKYNNLSPDDIKLMLKKCCNSLSLPKNQQGWGLIDVNKLLFQEVSYARK